MAEFLSDASLCYSSELNLFAPPLQMIGKKKCREVEFLPTNEFSSQGIIQFNIPSSGGSYIDPNKIFLNIRAKIVYKDGTPLPKAEKEPASGAWIFTRQSTGTEKKDVEPNSPKDGDNTPAAEKPAAARRSAGVVGVTDCFMDTLFSRVSVSLQNRLITDSDNCYPYVSFLKTKLFTPPEIKKESLEMKMCFSDPNSKLSKDRNWMLTKDMTFMKRSSYFTGSSETDMRGRLSCDIFDQKKLLPNGVNIQISLHRNDPEFSLISADSPVSPGYSIVITRASLDVTFVELAPEPQTALSQVLSERDAIYPILKYSVKKFNAPKGLHSIELNLVFENSVPSQLIFGILDAAASSGEYSSDPFYFERAGLSYAQCKVDGEDMLFSPMSMQYGKDETDSHFLDGYKSLFGINGVPGMAPFSREAFFHGCTLYRFAMDDEMVSGDIIPLWRTGNVRLSLKFDRALDSPKTIIVLGQFQNGFRLDYNRGIKEL